MDFYKHKCLQCGVEFTNKYPESKFCSVSCSVDYHLTNINFYRKNKSLCKLCSCQKENSQSDYCNSCQEIIENFNKIKNTCYICGDKIKDWGLKYYKMHGRVCIKCIMKNNEKSKNK